MLSWTSWSRSLALVNTAVLAEVSDFARKVSSKPLYLTLTLQSLMGKTKGGFYAVARGRNVGIFNTWDECKSQVDGFQNARYKKFASQGEADKFIAENRSATTSKTTTASTTNHKSTAAATSTKFDQQFSGSGLKTQARIPRSAILVDPVPRPAVSTAVISEQKRNFSTTPVLDKRKLKVTEERVVNKRLKTDKCGANSKIDLSEFSVDEEGYFVIYTDGACTQNGRKGARAGIGVWFGDDHRLNISEPVKGRQTNNTAEIQAAERAIVQAKSNGIDKIKLKTDSQFTINCVTKWMNKWKRNGWVLNTGKPVINREDLQKLDAAMSGMEIKWSYVAGHKGHYGNEAADRLAVQGAERA